MGWGIFKALCETDQMLAKWSFLLSLEINESMQ